MDRAFITNEVRSKIAQSILNEMIEYFITKRPPYGLWGIHKPPEFESDMVYLCLYRDLFNVGYNKLSRVLNFPYKIANKSLHNNFKIVRNVLKSWAEDKIIPGSTSDWIEAASNCQFQKEVEDTNLWLDSVDIRLPGKNTLSKKDPMWSYKKNGPGRRFECISDANQVIRLLKGPLCPKLYDADFIKLSQDLFNEVLSGGVIIADNHYDSAKKSLKHCKLYTNFREKKKLAKGKKKKRSFSEMEGNEEETNEMLPKKQRDFNRAHRAARARVESPFGLVTAKFQCLKGVFNEDEDQLLNVVTIACVVHNLTI